MQKCVIFLVLIGTVLGAPKSRIINGQEAKPHSIPYQAFLKIYSPTQAWYCGGTLISQNYVLTAGHCGVDATKAEVTLGVHNPYVKEETQIFLTSTVIKVHENYRKNHFEDDIALIRLPEPVTLTDAIQWVDLSAGNDLYEDVIGRISGWGITENNTKLADGLRFVDVPVIANSVCERTFGSLIDDEHVCTKGEGGSCNGDSGGPLTVNGTQIGIVSFSLGSCPVGYPSVFTRVNKYVDWIETNTEIKILH